MRVEEGNVSLVYKFSFMYLYLSSLHRLGYMSQSQVTMQLTLDILQSTWLVSFFFSSLLFLSLTNIL